MTRIRKPCLLPMSAVLAGAAYMLALPPASAVDNAKQLLVGGGVVGADSINYTAPGLSIVFDSTLFAGSDTDAAQLRMPVSGKLARLRLSIVTQNVAATGSFVFEVLRNGAATAMKCSIPKPASKVASCTSTNVVSFNSGDKISIKIDTDMIGGGEVAFTHTFVVD